MTATTTVSGVSWTVSGIDASSLIDGPVTYAVTETDALSNTTSATQAEAKFSLAFTSTPAIFATNVSTVSASGTGDNGDAISVIVTDGTHTTTAATTTVSGGSWSVAGINASSLNDATVTYSVTETSGTFNTTATATAGKDLANITEAANVVTYTAGPGINDNVSVTISGDGTYFIFNDTAEALYTTIAGESGSGTNTVDIPTTGVTGIVLSLSNGADAISSTGVVLGTLPLTIGTSGGPGVTVNGPISTSGSTTINAGTTLQVVNGGSLGTGPITDSGSLKFNLTSALAVSNVISGTGTLIQAGSGTTTLSGANTYSGGTTISAGTIMLGSATALGAGTGAVTVATGAVLDLNGQTMTNTNPLTLNGTGISGGGALINSSTTAGPYPGIITLGSASSIVATSGNISLSNPGAIGGAFALTLGGTANGTIASPIATGAGTLTENGTGTWTLSGANTYTGAQRSAVVPLKLGQPRLSETVLP